MKTAILTIAIVFAAIFTMNTTTYAANTKADESTTLTEISNISEIEIHGNVELYVSDGANDRVKVYNNYYSDNALVQDENGVLRITSYSTQKLVVWVTALQLQKLSAYDNADIKSFGKLSAISLDVQLYNHASAQLNLEAFSTSVSLNDNAKAALSGDIDNAAIQYDYSSSVNTAGLTAAHFTKILKTYSAQDDDISEFASL